MASAAAPAPGPELLERLRVRMVEIAARRRGYRDGFAPEDPLGDWKAGQLLARELGFRGPTQYPSPEEAGAGAGAGAEAGPPGPEEPLEPAGAAGAAVEAGDAAGAAGGGGSSPERGVRQASGGSAGGTSRGKAQAGGSGGAGGRRQGVAQRRTAGGYKVPQSGFIGVTLKSINSYQAKVSTGKKKVKILGTFNTAAEAARAYDEEVRKVVEEQPDQEMYRRTNFKSDEDALVAVEIQRAEYKKAIQAGGTKKCINPECDEDLGKRAKICTVCKTKQGCQSHKFRGVTKRDLKGRTTYQAKVWVESLKLTRHVATCNTAEEAALEYDRAYRKLNGEPTDPSKLNFPSEDKASREVEKALKELTAKLGCRPPPIKPKYRKPFTDSW